MITTVRARSREGLPAASRARQPRRLLLAFLTAVGAVLFIAPSVASAHSVLLFSTPSASSVLPKSPDRIELGFNEAVDAKLSDIRLFDADQREIGIGNTEAATNNASVVVADIPELKDGTYVVVWRVTSADGHPVNGAFPFEIGTVSSGKGADLVDKVVAAAQKKSPLGPALSVGKFLGFLGFVLLAGVMLFGFGTQLLGSRRALLTALTGLVLLLVGALAVLLLQGAYVTGGGWGDAGRWSLVNEVMRTRVGGAIIARIVLALLWMLVVQSLRRSPWTSVTSLVVWLLSVLTAVTFSVSGHPSADTLTGIFVPIDIAHLVGITVWVGGLFSIMLLRREVDGNDLVAPAITRFSRNATWAMPLVIITGVAQTLHLTDGVSTLNDSGYGRFIIAKLALVFVALVLGTRARRSLAARGTASIMSLVRVEATIALVILALSAALVSTSPNASNQQVPTFTASLVQRNIIAEITISPARVGESEIHALFTPPGGAITPVKAVKVRMELPAKNVPAIPVEMIQLGANHWSGVVQFPYSGDWTVEVLVTPDDNAQIRYSTVATIKG